MRLHQSGAHRIALILAILTVTCEISWASKQCKSVVMDVQVKKCRLGAERAKRGLERFDMQKYDEKYEAKRQEGPDYSKMKDSATHGVPQKRQLSAGQISGITLPIVAEAINGAARARVYATSGTEYSDPRPSLLGSTLGWPREHYFAPPYPLGRGVVPVRAPALNDGLDLNDEELDELYNDIYERLPRAPKDEAWKVFLETASKCCQNVDRCLKETMYVPCLESQMF
ncbi:uncharacterized protein LOC112454446 [Temnothorax curvispinosus]|uniref:Uncharacterized protein LOC112454446 n=1 Tax=Temnothorax curvispinosus TaxID=300111 RepID=A0A6J1PRG3_9HYME|nr:uncharacterized protein LOC112454446 [Temnothorax curvispinosus]